MKSQKQMHDHEPSSLIPLHDGMVLSFINYEIRVNLEKKDANEVDKDNQAVHERKAAMASTMPAMGATMAAATPAAVHVEEPVAVVDKEILEDEEVKEAIEEAEIAEVVAVEERKEADAAEEKAEALEAVAI